MACEKEDLSSFANLEKTTTSKTSVNLGEADVFKGFAVIAPNLPTKASKNDDPQISFIPLENDNEIYRSEDLN